MSVSKQDWKDWNDQYWTGAGGAKAKVEAAIASIHATTAAMSGGDAPRFLELTGGDAADSMKQLASEAYNASSRAEDGFKDLTLKGNQKRFANDQAIEASDKVANQIGQLQLATYQFARDLVRGVQMEHEEVAADASAVTGDLHGLADRLGDARYTMEATLEGSDAAVTALMGITKIGRF